MDRVKETAAVVLALNKYRNESLEEHLFIKEVCSYFDLIKNETLSQADFKFLKFIANSSGIPQFYSILEKFAQNPFFLDINSQSFAAMLFESTLHTDEINILHKYQKQILNDFTLGVKNRIFLSASTSFGKTHLVFEIIKKMRYKNIVLLFPTIALLSENFERLTGNPNYSYFLENYTFHTLSEVKNLGERNIFIYTPERFLSYIEKGIGIVDFDFSFVDEVYKIDNDYLIDQEVRENERDVAYRLAVFNALANNSDILLAGPYMEFADSNAANYNNSFNQFLLKNEIKLVNYNDYEIVNKQYFKIDKRTLKSENEILEVKLPSNKNEKLLETIKSLLLLNQNSIVYCANRGRNGGVEFYADKLTLSNILEGHNFQSYVDLINHLITKYSDDWIVVRALKQGIGIHHGLVPKYVQKEIIRLFNEGMLKVLISTTTITEGVNTSAKNLIVMHSKKGNKDLKKFDAKNIAGRAGRFMHHYSGRVIDLSTTFLDVVNGIGEPLKHKNYDSTAPKDEIDLFYSDDEFLSTTDIARKENVRTLQLQRGIPDFIMESFAVVSRRDKIAVYDSITRMTTSQKVSIRALIRNVNAFMNVDYDGMQTVLDIISPIANENMNTLIEIRDKNGYSIFTSLVYFYLRDGFRGSIDYHLGNGKHIDQAIAETAKFVYSTLKYQAVKYLGVFNLMYRYNRSLEEGKSFEDVKGFERLLLKFEYNALTDNGRLASDFGVPSRIIDFYEAESGQRTIQRSFDQFEEKIFERIEKIIKRNE